MGGRSAVTEVPNSAVLSAAAAIDAIPNPFMIGGVCDRDVYFDNERYVKI